MKREKTPDGAISAPSGVSPGQMGRLRIWELFLICAGSCLPVFLLKGLSHISAIACLRLCLMSAAGAEDMRSMHIRNIYALLLIASGFCGEYGSLVMRLIFSVLFYAVFALYYRFRRGKCVGGADIKLLTALMFCYGPADFCIICGFICIFLLLAAAGVIIFRKRELFKRRLPFAPLIWAGVLAFSLI